MLSSPIKTVYGEVFFAFYFYIDGWGWFAEVAAVSVGYQHPDRSDWDGNEAERILETKS